MTENNTTEYYESTSNQIIHATKRDSSVYIIVVSPFLTIADVMQRKKKLTDWLFTRKDRLIQKNHMFLYECLLTYLKNLRQTSYESFELFVSHFLHLMCATTCSIHYQNQPFVQMGHSPSLYA